jgi:chromosome segregation ATPase
MLVKRVGYEPLDYRSDGIRAVASLTETLLPKCEQNIVDHNMGKSSRDKLEDLRANNVELREENESLKVQVKMFNQRMAEMEKHMETSTKLFPFLKKKFKEGQDSLIAVRTDWDKHRAQLVYLGEKVIQMDNWKEDRFTQMMTQLQQDLEEKEKALERLQAVVQEHRGARKPSISTADASTMTETTLVSSPSIDISQEKLGEFEKHTRVLALNS